jgi:hypothetical protein
MECYWGNPTAYNHIAMKAVRRLDLHWDGDEVQYFDSLQIIADQQDLKLPDFIKEILADRAKE